MKLTLTDAFLTPKQKRKLVSTLSFSLKILIGLLIISPLFYALSVSFMSRADVMSKPPKLLPDGVTLRNYIKVFESVPLLKYLTNTLIVSAVEIIAQIFFCSFAAYAFTFFEFKGKKLLFSLVIATMMIPHETTVVSNYLTIQQLDLVDTYLAIVFPTLVSGMGIFLMRQYYLTVPQDLKDAATVDGCGDIAFFFRILMPISLSSITSLGIYVFVLCYNRFFWPLLVTNSDKMRTIQIGASFLMNFETIDYGVVMAGAIITLITSILVFVVGMKYLVQGMTSGSIKG